VTDHVRVTLVDADPFAREGGMSVEDVGRIRGVVVAAADAERDIAFWPRPIFVGATLAVMMLAGIIVGSGLPRRETVSAQPTAAHGASQSAMQLAERRQLQFATPGGTRIIWVFDPAFNP
jgi:hypothetical protein